jgi:hypothetical protein
LRGGLLTNTIFHALACLACYYSLWMTAVVASYLQVGRFEALWKASGYVGEWLLSFFTFLACEGYIALYCGYVVEMWTVIVTKSWPNTPQWVTDPYLVLLVIIIACLPILLRRDKHFIALASVLKLILVVIFIDLNVYFCILCNTDPKYAPADRTVSWFDPSLVVGGIVDYIVSYENYMLVFTSFATVRTLTLARLKKCLKWSLGITFLVNEVSSYLQVFMLYGDRTEPLFFAQLDALDWPIRAMIVVLLLFFLLTFPPYIEALRVSALALAWEMDRYPLFVWASTGLIWVLVAAMLSSIAHTYLDPLTVFATVLVGPLQFGVPALMLLKRMPDLAKIHWAGIVFFIVFAVVISVWEILYLAGAV